MGTVVYKYGLLPPIEGKAIVLNQMMLAHRYANTLTEIERARRTAQREALAGHPDLLELEQANDRAKDAVEAQKARIRALRTRAKGLVGAEGAEERARLKELQGAAQAAYAALHAAHVAVKSDAAYQAEKTRIDNLAWGVPIPGSKPPRREGGLFRGARDLCGLYWGTYQLVEAAADASRQQLAKSGVTAELPSFKRSKPMDYRTGEPVWNDEGCVSVQIINGMSSDKVFSETGTQVRVEHVDAEAWYSPIRSIRRRKNRTKLWLRVGSDNLRKPIWAVFPMKMHRPLPDGLVKRVTVTRKMFASRSEWTVEFSVECERASATGTHGAVAVNVGWRKMPGGDIRVATALGEDGQEWELRIDNRIVSGLEKVESLASIRDRAFDAIKVRLASWLKQDGVSVPAWMTATTSHLAQWKSILRLTSLVYRWKLSRFEGDDDIFTEVEAWRYHDFHLHLWQECQRKKSLRRRREQFRIFARDLARHYGTLVLEKAGSGNFTRKAPPGVGDNPNARWQRQAMAPSQLREVLTNAFRGAELVDASNSTRTCNECGTVASFKSAEGVYRAPCPGKKENGEACSATWDQDVNLTTNILAKHFDGLSKSSDSKKKKTTKWVTVKEGKLAKSAVGQQTASQLSG